MDEKIGLYFMERMFHKIISCHRLPGFMNIKVYPCDSNTFWEIEHSAQINSRAFMASVNRLTSAVNSEYIPVLFFNCMVLREVKRILNGYSSLYYSFSMST